MVEEGDHKGKQSKLLWDSQPARPYENIHVASYINQTGAWMFIRQGSEGRLQASPIEASTKIISLQCPMQ